MRKIKIKARVIFQIIILTILVHNACTQKFSSFSEKTNYTINLTPKIFDIAEGRIKEKTKFRKLTNSVELSPENFENDNYREYLKSGNDNYLIKKEESVVTSDNKYNKDFKIEKRNLQANNSIGNENIKYMIDNNKLPFNENEHSIHLAHDALEKILSSHTHIYTNLLSISLPSTN